MTRSFATSLDFRPYGLGGIGPSYCGWDRDDAAMEPESLDTSDDTDSPDVRSALSAAEAFVGSAWYQIWWPESGREKASPPPLWVADVMTLTERVESARAGMVSISPPRVRLLEDVYAVGWGSARRPWREHVHAGRTHAMDEYRWRSDVRERKMQEAREHHGSRRDVCLVANAVTLTHYEWNERWGMYLVSSGEVRSWTPSAGEITRKIGPSREPMREVCL